MTFDPTITLGALLQILVIIASVAAVMVRAERRLTILERDMIAATGDRTKILEELKRLAIQGARLEGNLEASRRGERRGVRGEPL